MSGFSPLHWLIAAGLVYMVWRFIRPQKNAQAVQAATPSGTLPGFKWPTLGQYNCEIVGEGSNQPTLKRLAGNHGARSAKVYATAMLVPYSTNPHDDKAVRVDINGCTVGHLSRGDARAFRRRLSANKLGAVPTACGALVMGGFVMREGELAHYGVRLDIAPMD